MFVVVLMLFVGFLVGFRTHTNSFKVIAGVGADGAVRLRPSAGSSPSSDCRCTNGEAAQAAAFPLLAPLVFASNAFVPTATMPDWLRWWAERQPVSVTVRGVRALMLGTEPMDYVWGSIAWSLAITVVLAPAGGAPLPQQLTPEKHPSWLW